MIIPLIDNRPRIDPLVALVGNPPRSMITVGKDGPSNVYVPLTAAEWLELGLPSPSAQWNCQDTATSMAPAIGAITITGTGNVLYNQTVTGWTRKFLGLQASGGVTGDNYFHTTAAALDLASGESGAWLIYASVAAISTNPYLLYAGDNGNAITISSIPTLRATHNSVVTTSAIDGLSAIVRPWIWYRNATTNVSGLLGIRENLLSGTHSEVALTGLRKGLGGGIAPGARASCDARIGLLAFWKGADAELIARRATLYQLNWPVSF